MKLTAMIEAAIATLEEKDRSRMRAAMQLGARFAIEAVVTRDGYYNSGTKAVIAELDGLADVPDEPAVAPAPLVEDFA